MTRRAGGCWPGEGSRLEHKGHPGTADCYRGRMPGRLAETSSPADGDGSPTALAAG
jgi:hypothetical protein